MVLHRWRSVRGGLSWVRCKQNGVGTVYFPIAAGVQLSKDERWALERSDSLSLWRPERWETECHGIRNVVVDLANVIVGPTEVVFPSSVPRPADRVSLTELASKASHKGH